MRNFASLLALAGPALAQQTAYGQCGGLNWTGETTCVSGYTCTEYNPYYSQCVPGSETVTTTMTTKATTTTTIKAATTSTKAATTTAKAVTTSTKAAATTAKSSTTTKATTTAKSTTLSTVTKSSTASAATSTSSTSMWWFGINESGAEFGETVLPGTYGTNYIFPDTDTIDVRPPLPLLHKSY